MDTVDLYALPGTQRKLSLRFLAWVILGEQIQQETHDSIEDSRTALRLYRKHEEYETAGVIDAVFERVWDEGTKSGWRPPGQGNFGGWRAKANAFEEGSLTRSEAPTPQLLISINMS